MALTREKLNCLLKLVRATKSDCLDCDGCFDQIAEFADAQLRGLSLGEAMLTVKTHLESCPCCADEYEALLAALKGIDES